MSFSIDGIASMLDQTANNAVSNNAAASLQGSLDGVSSDASEEELMQVCKDFESYFIEEVLKEVKKNMTLEDEDEDSSLSTLKDFYMDKCVELVADQMLEQTGNSFTQQLYEQMKRNYNIE